MLQEIAISCLEALANLLDNAIKFTPDGGHIELTLANTRRGPLIEVRDSGPGISPGRQADVFKRFYRGTQSRNVAGNGLGLSLVEAIVRLHDFSIEVFDVAPGCAFRLLCFTDAPAVDADRRHTTKSVVI